MAQRNNVGYPTDEPAAIRAIIIVAEDPGGDFYEFFFCLSCHL